MKKNVTLRWNTDPAAIAQKRLRELGWTVGHLATVVNGKTAGGTSRTFVYAFMANKRPSVRLCDALAVLEALKLTVTITAAPE